MTLGPLMVDVAGTRLTADEKILLRDQRVGGVILFSRNYQDPEQVTALTTEIHAVRKPSLLIAVDQEGGRVQRFREHFTDLPPARWLGRQFDIDETKARKLAGLCGWVMAAELREVGVDLSFAPVLDLDWGLSEIIGNRAFHKDPDIVARVAAAYISGMRKAGMVAIGKHFPGHGAVVPDSHIELPVDHRGYDEIIDDMRPYHALSGGSIQGVMMAHVRYPEVDRRIASLSPYWLQTELRQNIGFSGVIFSDDLNMCATESIGPMSERVRLALESGADMALICNNPDGVRETLDQLSDIDNPVGAGRLAALRPTAMPWAGQRLRDTADWKQAVAVLKAAVDAPELKLDG